MGTLILAKAGSGSASSDLTPLLVIVVLFVLLYMFMIRPQRNRQRQAMQTQRQAGNGSRIRTTSGIYGTIVDGDDQNVIVEVAPNVQIKMMRRAIMGVVPDDEPDGVRNTVPYVDTDESAPSAADGGDMHN